jgi:hypothetical protein
MVSINDARAVVERSVLLHVTVAVTSSRLCLVQVSIGYNPTSSRKRSSDRSGTKNGTHKDTDNFLVTVVVNG